MAKCPKDRSIKAKKSFYIWGKFVQLGSVSFRKTEVQFFVRKLSFAVSKIRPNLLHRALCGLAQTVRTAFQCVRADRAHAARSRQITSVNALCRCPTLKSKKLKVNFLRKIALQFFRNSTCSYAHGAPSPYTHGTHSLMVHES